MVVNWRGATGRGGAWGPCECPCFDRGEIEDSASALCQGKMTAAQNTDLRTDRVSDWCLQSDSCFKGCTWPKYTQHETEYLISHMRSYSFIRFILRWTLINWVCRSHPQKHSGHFIISHIIHLKRCCSSAALKWHADCVLTQNDDIWVEKLEICIQESCWKPHVRGMSENKARHRTSNPLFALTE